MKYLFTAKFADGSIYSQNEQDVSVIDPAKSCFYDVLQKIKDGNPLEIFCLNNEQDSFLIDLRDGGFEVNEARFYKHNVELPLTNFRLVYFRRHWQSLTLGGEEVGHVIGFVVGWQANREDTGENVEQTITVF